MNYKRIQNYAFSVAMILIGLVVMIDPVHYDSMYDHTFDFTGIRWPFGIGLFVFGIFALFRTFKCKSDDVDDVRKCPLCQGTFNLSDLKKNICPKCNIETEALKGFYERHPERK